MDPSGLEECIADDGLQNIGIGLATKASTSLSMATSAIGVLAEGDNAVNAANGLVAVFKNKDKYENIMKQIKKSNTEKPETKKQVISKDTKNYCECISDKSYKIITEDLDPIKKAVFCKIQVMDNPDSNTTCN